MGDMTEKTMRKYGDELRSSLGAGRAPSVPLGMGDTPAVSTAKLAGVVRDGAAMAIELARIVPDPEQPRRQFDEADLDRLAASLKARGQLQNCVVIWDEGLGSYVIVSGERRWRAAQRAGLPTLRCMVLDRRPDDAERLSLQLIENCVRVDLAGSERALAFRRLLDATGWSQERLAVELNVSAFTVSATLKILELPEAVRAHVDAGRIGSAAAYELAKLDDPEARLDLAERIVAEGLTRDDVITEVQARKGAAKRGRGAAAGPKSKGRGSAARKVTRRVIKLAGGKVTIERTKGIDSDFILAAADALRGLAEPADARPTLSSMPEQGEAPPSEAA